MRKLPIRDVISRLFPEGSQGFLEEPAVSEYWPAAPDFPPDLFGAVGYLLDNAGAYQYGARASHPNGLWGPAIFGISPDVQERCINVGRTWCRTALVIPAEVVELWKQLGTYAAQPLYLEHTPGLEIPHWWRICMELLIIADEACSDVGFGYTEQLDAAIVPTWVADFVQSQSIAPLRELSQKMGRDDHITFYPKKSTICFAVDPDVACVQPKSRTPSVGCTLRTFTHNLSLLPPRGVVRATWQRPPQKLVHDDIGALNLLLVPYPYRITARSFSSERCEALPGARPWGWFALKQSWLRAADATGSASENHADDVAVIEFVHDLIAAAKEDVGSIHGVVLPEYALDWDTYEQLVIGVKQKFPDVEFFVSGSSSNCAKEIGNVAISTVFTKPSNDLGEKPIAITTSRAKHHRWKLDDGQISTYALGSALDPRLIWWEQTILPKREVQVNVFRTGSTFSAMICEDLARVDPAHAVLRSVAPSLVFVLLMDGPQLPSRWSARYATVFADDPGSSVLTLTSAALLNRARDAGHYNGSRSIALWKQENGQAMPIELPSDHHAVVLTLSGQQTNEVTLDGRPNRDGRAWRYHGQQPLKLKPRDRTHAEMIQKIVGV